MRGPSLRPDPIGRLWDAAPSPDANEDRWSDFKAQAYAGLVEAIERTDHECSNNPAARVLRLRMVRREHHILVVADRIRRGSGPGLSKGELRNLAENVVDPPALPPGSGAKRQSRRSRNEQKMLISARVNWHKLMRRAGSSGELRSALPGLRPASDAKYVLARIRNPALSAADRGDILAKHLRDRLEQLLLLSDEVFARTDCAMRNGDQAILKELDQLVASFRRQDD